MIRSLELHHAMKLNSILMIMQSQNMSKEKIYRMREYRDSADDTSLYFKTWDEPTVRYITFIAYKQYDNVTCFLVQIGIEPYRLVGVNNLFECTPDNLVKLEASFSKIMSNLFSPIDTSDEYQSLIKLSEWKMHSICFAKDLLCESADLFVAMIQKVAKPQRPKLDGIHPKKADKRFWIKKKTFSLCLYVQPNHNNYVRFEYWCSIWMINNLRNSFHIEKDNKSVYPFLLETIADQALRKAYLSYIGSNDFCRFCNEGKKRIAQSRFSKRTKEKLMQFVMLCGQARHLSSVQKLFVTGNGKLKNTDIVVHGSNATFRHRLHQFEDLRMNPMPIPKNFYTNKKYGDIPNILSNPIPKEWK